MKKYTIRPSDKPESRKARFDFYDKLSLEKRKNGYMKKSLAEFTKKDLCALLNDINKNKDENA